MVFEELFVDPSQWRHAGLTLGLAPYQSLAGYTFGGAFRHLKRSIGLPAMSFPPAFTDWHFGQWNGVEALVITYTVGSGKNKSRFTAVTTRIDPPLFLGLTISSKPLVDWFEAPNILTGIPWLDESIRIGGFDKQRVLEFFALNTPEGVEVMRQIISNSSSLRVADSMVTLTQRGRTVDPNLIRLQLDFCAWLSKTLAARRANFPWTPAETAQMDEWQRFANDQKMTFDRQRMTIFGNYQNTPIKVALETAGLSMCSSINVRFPQQLNVGFSVIRTESPEFLQGLFDQDIEIGDPAFDQKYKVMGHPEPLVRQALAKPALVDALNRLATVSGDVQMNQSQLYFRVADPLTQASSLHQVCESGRIACAAFFGEMQNIGPYR